MEKSICRYPGKTLLYLKVGNKSGKWMRDGMTERMAHRL